MDTSTKYELGFIAVSAIILIVINEFFIDGQLHWFTFLLLLASYFTGRLVNKKVRKADQSKAIN